MLYWDRFIKKKIKDNFIEVLSNALVTWVQFNGVLLGSPLFDRLCTGQFRMNLTHYNCMIKNDKIRKQCQGIQSNKPCPKM